MAVKESNERTLVTLPKELKEKLVELADQNSRTLSKQIQFILQEYVDTNNKSEEKYLPVMRLVGPPESKKYKLEKIKPVDLNKLVSLSIKKALEEMYNNKDE